MAPSQALTALKAFPTSALEGMVSASSAVLKRLSKVGESVRTSFDGLFAKSIRQGDDVGASIAEGAAKSDAITVAKQGTPPVNSLPPPSASSTTRAAAKDSVLARYGITPTKVFAGVSATVLASLALARLDATDGVKVSITDIKILDADKVQIKYTPSDSNFSPCINDTFTFYPPPNPDATPTSPDLSIGGDKTVIQVIDDNTIVIRASLTRAGNSVYPSPAPAPSPSGSPAPAPTPTPAISWGKMTCHSDYENQLAQGIGEAVAFAAGTAATAIVQTVGALTPAAAQVLGAAAGGAATVLAAGANAVAPAVNDLLAPIKDFFMKFKWIILAICIILCGGLAAFIVLS